MFYLFGKRTQPCHDCWQIEGEWYCTMNCGPRVVMMESARDKARERTTEAASRRRIPRDRGGRPA